MAALPNTGITTSMVASAIGAATNDVGSLCKHSNVNKWSKWKPISIAKVTGLTESDFINANFGLYPQEATQIKNYQWNGSNTEESIQDIPLWAYTKPTGGATSPFRIGDFRNYNHDSKPPVKDVVDITISQQDVEEYNDSSKQKYWHPSFKFGSGTYDVVGSIDPNNSIPLYQFTMISGSVITDGNWRLCLGIFKDGKFYIATSEAVFSANMSASDVYKTFVSLFKYAQVRNILFNMPFDTSFQAIPFFGYKMYQDTENDAWYFNSEKSKGFYFPLGNVINVNRIEYVKDIKLSIMSILTTDSSFDYAGVNYKSTADVQGTLNVIKAPSPTSQRLRLYVDAVSDTVVIHLSKSATRLQFQKTNKEWIDLPLLDINGTTSGDVTLLTDMPNYFTSQNSEILKSYLDTLTRFGDGVAYYKGGVRLLDNDGTTTKVYALAEIDNTTYKWFRYDVSK